MTLFIAKVRIQSGNLFDQAPDLVRLYERLLTLIQAPSQNQAIHNHLCKRRHRLYKRQRSVA